MFILYLDESGDPHGWHSQKNFVIGGIAVHEGQIYSLTRQVDDIQRKYFPSISIQLNLHAHEIAKGMGHFRGLGITKQQELLRDVYGLIHSGSFPRFVMFATDMDISAAVSSGQTVYDTFQDVCQRFNTLLVRLFNRGTPTKGLLVIDQAHEQQYRDLLRQFQTTGTRFGYVNNIIDVPYFAHAVHTRMIQLADFITYATYIRYEHNDSAFFDMIKDRFDRRSPGSPPEALKHLTKSACACESCAWRR